MTFYDTIWCDIISYVIFPNLLIIFIFFPFLLPFFPFCILHLLPSSIYISYSLSHPLHISLSLSLSALCMCLAIFLSYFFLHVNLFSLLLQISVNDSNLRYAGYSAGFARAFRYLAFTSDFGEALRPVISSRLVLGEILL